ncbi:MAG: SH3 domain-containing protein [Nitrosospira sp.]|nr:SH3 domain-containing protein [Nitrosospira sp.]
MSCSSLLKPLSSEIPAIPMDPCAAEQREIERLQKLLVEKDAQQQEIERLQNVLADKEAQIRVQQVQQRVQARTLRETTNQALVKVRRLATRPAAASAIAEAEAAMENLKSFPFTDSEQAVQTQAQRLLSAAAASYAKGNHVSAMDYAAHARGFIDMINNNRTFKVPGLRRVTTPFEVPIPLRTTVDSNLRQRPGLSAAIYGVLEKGSRITADAYQGDWLHVQAADGQVGWVLNALVEAQLDKP